jgi:hypothetical protein
MGQAATVKERYDGEQDKLRRKLEGKPEPGEITSNVKPPEVNPEVYRDVVPLLFRGFLTVSAEINEVPFVFKSLNQHEFEMVRFLGGFQSGIEATSKFWDLFLAYGVFIIDGHNILIDRESSIHKISESFRDFPSSAKQKIIRHLSELNRKASNATLLTEAYAMETYSRFRWAQLQNLDLCQPSVTGVPGTEKLGLNWAQLTWRSLNYYEDQMVVNEREWENAKFVGACFAGKGIQKIYNQDTDRRRKTQEERITRKDRLLRHVFEGVSLEDESVTQGGSLVKIARSVEELADQLEKSLRGEKDFHDRAVEEFERRAKEQRQSRHQQLEEAMAQSRKQFSGRAILGEETSLIGLSPEEVQDRIRFRKQYEAQNLARLQERHPEVLDEKLQKFYEKQGYGNDAPSPLTLTDKDPAQAVPLVPQRNVGKPFRSR